MKNICIRCSDPIDEGLVCSVCVPSRFKPYEPPTCPECGCELDREPLARVPWCDDCSESEAVRFNWKMGHSHPSQWVDGQGTPQQRAAVKRWLKDHPEALAEMLERSSSIRSRCTQYGISIAQWLFMAVEQDGGCAICGQGDNPMRLSVDHDHHDLHVRGLLCHRCNIGLGHLRVDGPGALDRAQQILAYVEKTSEIPESVRTDSPA